MKYSKLYNPPLQAWELASEALEARIRRAVKDADELARLKKEILELRAFRFRSQLNKKPRGHSMKIKLLVSMSVVFDAGETCEWDTEDAKRLIDRGYAEAVKKTR